MDVDSRSIAVGFAFGLVALLVLLWGVGLGDVARAFADLQTRYVTLIVLGGLGWLAAWGLALRTVLGILGVPASPWRGFLLYASAAFANNVTPFGQAGGEPFSAWLIARATGTEYERALATIASVDSLNFVPSIVLALSGLGYYLAIVAVQDQLVTLVLLVALLAVAVPAAVYAAWRNRSRVENGVARAVGPATRTVGRVLPRYQPPTEAEIRRRVGAFFRSLERIGDEPGQLLVALSFSGLGWGAMCVTLWLALFALGHPVPAAAVLIAVPVGSIAGVTPLPGGLGGVEFAIVLLIVPTTGVSPATASAAALIYRGATYWLSLVVGAGATAWLQGVRLPTR